MQLKSTPVRFGRGTSAAPRSRTRAGKRTRPATRSRLGAFLSWPISVAMFAIPLVLVALTVIAPRFAGSPSVAINVTDRYAGTAIANAEVVVDGQPAGYAADGTIPVTLGDEPVNVVIQAPGFETVTTTLTRDAPRTWQVGLRPNVLNGRVTDAESTAGVANAEMTVRGPDGSMQKMATGPDGSFAFSNVPDGATLAFSSLDYGTTEEPIGQRTTMELSVKPSFVDGVVVDDTGKPIPSARVSASNGSAETFTDDQGAFRLTGGNDVSELQISAAGYAPQQVGVDASRQVSAQLQTEMIKGIYANLGVLGDQERWNRLLEIADTTEINAIVIDVKQDTIYYDTQVPFFRNIEGMVTPVLDMESILKQMHEHGIYAIARMVVFKDPVVAAGRPDLAVKDEVNGGLWLDMNDTPWVNAFQPELWQANADLAVELANMGFDEVQYDYIRLPSDGDLKTADFGSDYSESSRRAAITGAVTLASEQMRTTGKQFSLDLFPIIALMGDDQGIGQTLQDLTPLADYISLMIYPSHFERGNIPVDGHPNDFPAETVTYTLQKAEEITPGTIKKQRPWLQDFDYPLEGYSEYGPAEVRAQIDAAEAMGVSGWILWNAAGEFQAEALNPG